MRSIIIALLIIIPALSGCVATNDLIEAAEDAAARQERPDVAMVAPDMAYYAVKAAGVEGARFAEVNPGYHTLEAIMAKVDAIAKAWPDVVRLEIIGESNEGRPLKALVFDALSPADAPVAFIDGGHHANEYEGVESTLFLADFLATNGQANATIRGVLETTEVWVVPLVSPDGYTRQSRYNANAVNLNRNYDFEWCAEGASNNCETTPLGPSGEYAGPKAFSEPETRAIRDATLALGDRLAYYVSLHTAAHCITSPWTAPNPPYEVPPEHRAVFDEVYAWVKGNTEFGAGGWHGDGGDCMDYWAGGTSMDWAYDLFQIPTFTMETGGYAGPDDPVNDFGLLGAGVRDLEHWVWATIPIHLYMLQNAEGLRNWDLGLGEPVGFDGATG